MDLILPARRHWPLYSLASAREREALALASHAPHTLMRRAGTTVARLTLALAPHAQRIWVAAGPGNNGGDGFEAALQLQRLGKQVELCFAGDVTRLPADAAISLSRARDAGVSIRTWPDGASPALATQDLAIDALLGLGGRRAPQGAIAALIAQLNALPCPVLAVDIPSGLDGDSGQTFGELAVRADHTLALLSLRPGLFTGAGRDHAGTVWFDELGAAADTASPDAWLGGAAVGLAGHRAVRSTGRQHAQHKGSFGDVIVVGGAAGMAGAAVLAARAAHAAGAGRVWVAALDREATQLDPVRPELMWRQGLATFDDAALAQATVVCGCGGGAPVAAELPRLLDVVPRLLLDADALNAVAEDPALQALLRRRANQGQVSMLTPHPLEAARLLGTTTAAVQADRLASAHALAERYRCVVVLKGSGSVIAAPGETPVINASGNAALATAGTGDVLAGWMGGCWSAAAGQRSGSADSPLRTAFNTACAAVWWHGHAAETAARSVLRAADLIEEMAKPTATPAG